MPGFLISAVVGAALSSLFSGAAFLTTLAFTIAKGAAVYLIRSLFADDPEPPPQPQTNFTQSVSASQYVFGYSRITPPLVFAGRAQDSEATAADLNSLYDITADVTGQYPMAEQFYENNYQCMVCVYALSEGPSGIAGVERIWANNIEIPLNAPTVKTSYTRITSKPPFRNCDKNGGHPTFMAFVITESSTGVSAASKTALQAVLKKLFPNKWTDDHTLPMSYMVVIYKPEAVVCDEDGKRTKHKEASWINGVPKIEVLVKGMKLALPTDADGALAAATWTRNAADIRWWFETHIRGRTVNYASYAAAKTICGQTVNPPGSPVASTPALDRLRYAADGVFRANEDLDAVGAQLDRCWQGFTALKNGEWHFYPGSNRAVATTIDAADVIRVERTQLGAGIRDRYNQISASMQQSANADWQQTSLPLLIDGDAKTADGGLPLELKWGTLGYIIDPYQAVRCMRLALRRGRRTNLYQVTCVPGAMMANAELHPGDVVTFNHPLIHAINQRCVILNSTINPDMSVSLQLLREDSTVYTAAITDVPFDASGELSLNSVDNNREQEESEKITARSTDGAALSISSDCVRNVLSETSGLIWFWQPVGATTFEWRDGTVANSQWTRDDTKLLWYYVSDDSELVALPDENGNHHSLATLKMPVSPSTRTALDITEGTVVTGVGASTSGGTDDVPTSVSISVSRATGVREVESETKVRYYVLGTTATRLGVTKANLVIRPLDDEDDFGTQWCDTTPVTTPSGGGGDSKSTSTATGTTTDTSIPINMGSGSGGDNGGGDNGGGNEDVTPMGVRTAVFDEGMALSWDDDDGSGSWYITVDGNTDYRRITRNRELLLTDDSFNAPWNVVNGTQYTIVIRRGGHDEAIVYTAKLTPSYEADSALMITPGDGQLALTWSHASIANGARYWDVIVDGEEVASTQRASRGYTITGLTNGQEYKVAVVTVDQRGSAVVALDQRATAGTPAQSNPLNLAIGTITSRSDPDGWIVPVTYDGTTQYRFNLTADDGATASFSPAAKPRNLTVLLSTFSAGDVVTLDAVTNADRTTVLSRVTFTLPPRT